MNQKELRAAVIGYRKGKTSATELQAAIVSFVGKGKGTVSRGLIARRTLRILSKGNNVMYLRYMREISTADEDTVTPQGPGSDDGSDIPLSAIKGVGEVTISLLVAIGIDTADDLAAIAEVDLADKLSAIGSSLDAGTLIVAATEAIGKEG